MTLSGQQFWEFQQALLAAFPTIGMLEQLVRVRLEQNLHAIAGAGSLTDVTRDLITWVEAQGRVNDLLDGAETDNPGNADLKAFAAAYRVAVKAATAEPVDLSPWVTIRDTGAEGTVAAMSLVTAAEIVLARKERPAALSARYLFEKAKKHDESAGDGTYLETVIYVAERFGIAPHHLWPYEAGRNSLPEGTTWSDLDSAASAYKAHGYRIASYEEITAQLGLGRPVVAAVSVHRTTWMSTEASGTGRIGVPRADDLMIGRHCVTIVRRDPASGELRFANTWGATWGDRGFGVMSSEAADVSLDKGQMWAVDVSVPD